MTGFYIGIDEFRRVYFSDLCRPTRAEVREWIETGANGVKLTGTILDGRYYVDRRLVDEFFRECDRAARGRKNRRSREEEERRSSDALAALREKYKVKC